MKRMIVFTAAAALAAIPAAAGLAGNSSLRPSVPVDPPTQAVVVDDRGGLTDRDDRTEPGDDRVVQGGVPSPSASPSATTVDDHGGSIDRDDRVEPGDDRDVNGGVTAPVPAPSASADDSGHDDGTEDSGRHGGVADDGSAHDAGDDHGGHGSDD
ncbi:hypothetical protein ASE38_15145 [Cellulomonas sp. Root930]|nr:hypothetical protein ASE38_15145 [Cellulomonas sp. Root930]